MFQVEGVVKNLAAQGETEKVSALINVLINDFAMSPQANHRKVSPPKCCCN
jgi:vacuole morphology and inheritance protein 14